jgi:hypothetical protein
MANYRVATLLPEEAKTAAGTKIIDLNISDVISRIDIKFDVLNASYTFIANPTKNITKIELVDGSDVLFSLSGYECQALNIYDRQCGSMNENCHLDANDEVCHFGIDFGRFLNDPMFALDPNRFTNLQLKITYTLTAANAAAVSGTLEVRAFCFDEKRVSPVGFLMSKEIYSYTNGASSSYEYVDFPVDYPIRKLLIRAFRTGYQPCDTISEFRIDENMEQKIPMDWATETYFNFMMTNSWKPIQEFFQAQVSTDSAPFYVTPTWYWRSMTLGTLNAAPATWVANTLIADVVYLDSTAGSQVWGSVFGYIPHHTFEVPFGNPQEPSDWYSLTGKSQVRLRLKTGGNGANGATQIVLQQLRKY